MGSLFTLVIYSFTILVAYKKAACQSDFFCPCHLNHSWCNKLTIFNYKPLVTHLVDLTLCLTYLERFKWQRHSVGGFWVMWVYSYKHVGMQLY